MEIRGKETDQNTQTNKNITIFKIPIWFTEYLFLVFLKVRIKVSIQRPNF